MFFLRKIIMTLWKLTGFGLYVGNKKNKVWLIYAYDRSGGEIVAYAWGKEGYCHREGIGSAFKRAQGYLWEYCYG